LPRREERPRRGRKDEAGAPDRRTTAPTAKETDRDKPARESPKPPKARKAESHA
jgi:hypothetical protein